MAFDTVLVANRGEIAVRILKTLRKQGLRSVAVFSEADRDAPHVGRADQAVCLGAGAAAQSYLSIDKVIAAATATGAGAIHPGYGFLSENADFAKACAKAGLVFVGPPPEAIRTMGDKSRAKTAMLAAGVPCIPGYHGSEQSAKALRKEASQIGYPVMLKAAAGGGGKGMRRVEAPKEFDAALELARSEATAAFGSGDMLIEKALIAPRHIEIQVFADGQGNVIHLGERDCSVQRRHQKILEEAPAPVFTNDLRDRMGETAVSAARTIGYVGAGTVEFLLDEANDFYFLEMNTRLQVEHPVTEMVTDTDLVDWQIRVAQGDALPMLQTDTEIKGHAIEARLYAENPQNGFIPCSGHVLEVDFPEIEGVRIDSGIESGTEVSTFYDPMLAKLIAHGPTRDVARQRLIASLGGLTLFGIGTNRIYLLNALRSFEFAAGKATTDFVEKLEMDLTPPREALALAVAVLYLSQVQTTRPRLTRPALFDLECNDQFISARVERRIEGINVTFEEQEFMFDDVSFDGRQWQMMKDGVVQFGKALVTDSFDVWLNHEDHTLHVKPDPAKTIHTGQHESAQHITAPMHGRVVAVSVDEGTQVAQGEPLVVLEAMKMQHTLKAKAPGIVSALQVVTGDQVETGQVLIELNEIKA